jgi:hypothetical protein
MVVIDENQRKSISAPFTVLDRSAAFAQRHGYQLLWCDQECIDQEDPEDKEPGIQAMDVIYERAAVCVAPLDARIITQAELDALATATKPAPFPDWENWHEWLEHMPWERILAMAKVIKAIPSDPWFSRAWIFQESTAAYATVLLIHCSKDLSVPEHLGGTPGEIELPLCAFRMAACKLHTTFREHLRKQAYEYAEILEDDHLRSLGMMEPSW